MENNFLIKILMIDDDEMFSLVISEALKIQENIEFKLVNNANDFFNRLDFQPDVAIIDYNLPEKKWFRNFNRVKTNEC